MPYLPHRELFLLFLQRQQPPFCLGALHKGLRAVQPGNLQPQHLDFSLDLRSPSTHIRDLRNGCAANER